MRNSSQPVFSADATLNISISDEWNTASVCIENCTVDQFLNAAQAVALDKITTSESIHVLSSSGITTHVDSDEPSIRPYTEDLTTEDAGSMRKEGVVSDITRARDELQAHLAANKAEVNAVAAEMRLEMAEFRALQSQQFANLSTSLSEIKGEISGLRGELTGNKDGISGQIDGLKSSISTMQWMVGTVLAMIGIAVAILAIPGIDKIL